MAGDAADWKRLGDLLIAARVRKGFTNRAAWVRHLGLKHDRTIIDIENAKRTNFERATLVFIEQAYGWQPGSIAAVLDGGEPTLTEENPRPEAEIDRSSVGSGAEDASYVADRGPNDPPARISDEELLAVIRRQRQELDELERRLTGGRPVDGAS